MQENYFDIVMLIERLQRLFLEVVRVELDRLKIADINSVQCVILYNVGLEKLSVGEVSNRGYYLGSNVTYNLKKMLENGYLVQEQSPHDRRSSYVKLSKKGMTLYESLEKMVKRHLEGLSHSNLTEKELDTLLGLMKKVEAYWAFMTTPELRF